MLARRKPLQAKTSLKRGKPLKAKPRPRKTAEECRHFVRVAQMPCLVCGARPVQIHHVTASIHGGRISRSHSRVVPLCFAHHKVEGGLDSVENLSHGGFYTKHGIDLLAEAQRLWEARNA